MRYRVNIMPEARRDLFRLNAFLAALGAAPARRAMDTIDAGLRSLAEMPDRAPEILHGARELMIPFGVSGYVVQFHIDHDTVIVARIFHMREDRSGSDE